MSDFSAIIVIVAGFIAYFLPGIIAASRKHHQSLAIFFLNLLLAWTIIGWIVALVWALTATEKAAVDIDDSLPPRQPVENFVTAKGGQLTYRVVAYRKMEKGELERAVLEALQAGRLKEPEPGGVATLVTEIGR